LEDKIVQQAVLWVLQAIYEQDFLGFSYGFRPQRSQHDALDALSVAIVTKKVNWILDADIKGFFDNIDHDRLMEFLEHRIGDRRILRLIRKWLKAGIIEDGEWSDTTRGTPQGAVLSPLLANVFLHYVFDLWIQWWRKQHCQGDVIVVRYADDFVIGFQHQGEAARCLKALHDRLGKFGLTLHEDKTRLIEFGRYAEERRRRKDAGRPETFAFLGFTHICGTSRDRKAFTVVRHTLTKRLRATLQAIKQKLRQRMHDSLGDTGRWLRSVAQGWMQYHAVPHNYQAIETFLREITRYWLHCLRRRSQRGRWTWERMQRVVNLYLPRPRILHQYPSTRFRARLKVGAV
jgi:group II intron reverse transcriptase/maturase